MLRERKEFLRQVVAESTKALRVARVKFDLGKVDFLNFLQQQGQFIAARINLLNTQDQRLQQRIDLHLAPGGSLDEKPAERKSNGTKTGKVKNEKMSKGQPR